MDRRHLRSSVRGEGGTDVVGDKTINFAVLAGDADGSETVNSLDMLAIRARTGQAVGSDTARYDVDCSGTITPADMRALRPLLGLSLP